MVATFTGAIFLSAALLFAVQPMFTKMVLPKLGGSPSVWSVAMVFFQAVLLAGYAYAHALTTHLPGKRSVIVHLAVMVAATLFLPLAIASWWSRPPADATAAMFFSCTRGDTEHPGARIRPRPPVSRTAARASSSIFGGGP